MHINLREWDVQTLGCEGLVHLFVHAEKHLPVVSRIDLGTHGDVDRAVAFIRLAELFMYLFSPSEKLT